MKKLIFVLLFPLTLNASLIVSDDYLSGVRPLGLSGAFTAFADDANAVVYNPAALSLLKYNQALINYSPLYLPGFMKSLLSMVYPVTKNSTLGISWYHLGFADAENGSYGVPELRFGDDLVTVGYGRPFILKNLAIGISAKFSYMSVELDGSSVGRGFGYNLSLSSLYQPLEKIKVGLVLNNIMPSLTKTSLLGTTVRYEDGSENMRFPFSFRMGAYYQPIKNLGIALDFVDPVCLGAEYWLFNMIGLRAGTRFDFPTDTSSSDLLMGALSFSGGASFKYQFGQADYAFTWRDGLPPVHELGMAFSWGYQAYLVDIVSVNINDVFPSLYKTYAKQEVVKLVLKNKSKESLQAKIGFKVDKVMKAPTEKSVLLKPGSLTEVELPAVFAEDILTVKDDSVVSGNIIISYRVEDKESKDISSHRMTLYGRNAFIWDDMDKVASFVTPQDPKVKEFSRGVLQAFRAAGGSVVSKNFHRAMLIFQALGVIGVTYVPDPSNPFGQTQTVIDYIQYPSETLKLRTGDCDDCTVLYASALESIGIRTACLITPDHIFMMFDSGLTADKAYSVFGDNELYIDDGETVWIPVETTMYGKTFFNAVKEGVKEMKKALASEGDESINVVNVGAAWASYQSSVPSVSDYELKQVDAKKMTSQMFKDGLVFIAMSEGQAFNDTMAMLKTTKNDARVNNKMGIYFGKYGFLDIAKEFFTDAAKFDPNWASPRSNMGNFYLLAGDYDKAINEYQAALQIAPSDPEITKNLEYARSLKNRK